MTTTKNKRIMFILLVWITLLFYTQLAQANLEKIGHLRTTGAAYGICLDGTAAYVADGYGGLKVIDISSPSDPQLAAHLDFPYHGSSLSITASTSTIAIIESHNHIQIVDINNPGKPILMSTILDEGTDYLDITLQGNILYTAMGEMGLEFMMFLIPPILLGLEVMTRQALLSKSLFPVQWQLLPIKQVFSCLT